MKKERLERVLENMQRKALEQMVITDPSSIFYLTGKWIGPGERLLALYINVNGNHKFILNKLFMVPEDFGIDKVWYADTEDSGVVLAGCIDSTKALGIDKTMVAKFLLRLMELGAASSYINGSNCIDSVRMCKDETEREAMRVVSKVNDKGIMEIVKLIKAGVTELEVASKIKNIFVEQGADTTSFTPIVAFGGNAADGHHEPDHTVLKEGDCIVLDVGCKKDSYCADMTRTFFYKKVSDKHREIYELVKKANETAEAMIKPGVRFCDIDAAARDIITQAGYGSNFNHRTGHSIGIDVHEFGDVSAVNADCVAPGMIFSIEPGIYSMDEVGVRIEDLVLVTETGCEVLNRVSKDLRILE